MTGYDGSNTSLRSVRKQEKRFHPSIDPSIVCNRFIPFMGFLPELIPTVPGRGQGTSLAHRRALIDGRGRHARCQPHIRSNLGFSILLKDTSTCRSAQPGAGIWPSDLSDHYLTCSTCWSTAAPKKWFMWMCVKVKCDVWIHIGYFSVNHSVRHSWWKSGARSCCLSTASVHIKGALCSFVGRNSRSTF